MASKTQATLLLLSVALVGCGGEKGKGAKLSADATGALSVLDWAGYEDTSMFTTFHQKYPKMSVSVAFGESDADIYAKMKAGTDACVFHFYTGWQNFYVTDGLALEIDTTRLANWSQVPARFKALG